MGVIKYKMIQSGIGDWEINFIAKVLSIILLTYLIKNKVD